MALRTFLVLPAAWPGVWVHNQFFKPGDFVQIDTSQYSSQLPLWSAPRVGAAGVIPGTQGWIAPKLAGTDATSTADLAASAAVLGVQASEATVTDANNPFSVGAPFYGVTQ
jgi:hypothetical protein